ncbi:MAG: hypothetical protein QW067_09305 [Thermofilaceae archaeon]
MRVVLVSEAPFVPSSLGKVVTYISAGLAERGFEVSVLVHSAATISTPFSQIVWFNPRDWAERSGSRFSRFFPDVWIPCYPWGRWFDLSKALERVGRFDAVLVYEYPQHAADLNSAVYESLTSRGVPAVVYALHEGPYIPPEAALSVLSYTRVVAPTRVGSERFLRGVLRSVELLKGEAPSEVSERFSHVPHPVNASLYHPSNAPSGPPVHGCDLVVGMLAKNHVRKDYLTLVEVALRLAEQTGRDVCAGFYAVGAVSGGYWSVDSVVDVLAARYGLLRRDVSKRIVQLPRPWVEAGMTEDQVIFAYTRLMDVHLFLTRGEAFGLPPLESALLGVRTVTTAIPEQVEVLGGLVDSVRAHVYRTDHAFLYQPDPDDAFEKVLRCVEGVGRCATAGLWEKLSAYDYREVSKGFEREFEEAVEDPRPLSHVVRVQL